jgi:hypothetical protein
VNNLHTHASPRNLCPPPPPKPHSPPPLLTQEAERELSTAYAEVAALQQQLAERDDDVCAIQQRMMLETQQWVSERHKGEGGKCSRGLGWFLCGAGLD